MPHLTANTGSPYCPWVDPLLPPVDPRTSMGRNSCPVPKQTVRLDRRDGWTRSSGSRPPKRCQGELELQHEREQVGIHGSFMRLDSQAK